MNRNFGSVDDDGVTDRLSPLLQTQRFTKSGTVGTKDFKMTQSKPKHNEVSNLKINLNRINDDDEDSLNDSDDDTNTKTGRSTSSGTTSQLTPKPKERLFLKKDGEKPKIKPRHIDIDDDDRHLFGQTITKSSPRQHILTLREEEEERNQSFMHGFRNEKKRQSPTDIFSIDQKFDSRRNSRKLSNDHEDREHNDSDDDTLSNKQSKQNDFRKFRHSSTNSDKLQSQRNRSKEGTDQSDNDDDDDYLNKHTRRQDFNKQRQSTHDLIQTSPKDIDSNVIQHQSSSSRPGSANKQEIESARRSSYCEDQDTIIPPITNQKSQSRPTSAKTNTTRQQTQSVIDTVTSANTPPTLDPLTSNNEALAATLQPSSPPPPPPRPSAKLPPKPKQRFNTTTTTTTTGGINKKQKYKVPSRYKEITSRVDTGRTPVSTVDLTQSIERALAKALKSQTLPRPQSARARKQSANSNNSERQRRRSTSAYENIKPRVNTNLSINFDELNTSQMRADSSQSIKDSVYLEWLKAKQDQKKLDKEELKRWQEEKAKRVDKSTLERKIYQDAQNLDRWRQEREEQMRKKKQEELQLKREQQENKKREQQQKRKDAKDGFEDWKAKKDEELKQKTEENQNKKTEIERRQEEKQEKILKAATAYEKWTNKKSDQIKKTHEVKKTAREDQLKKIRENEETKFVSAQDAYEKWLKEKDKYETEEKANTQRRTSLSAKQQQVPFLPSGAQKNTGKIRHVVCTPISVVVELLQRHTWHYYSALCNDTQIAAGNKKIGSGNLVYASHCPINVSVLASVIVPYTAYNILEKCTIGKGRTQICLPANWSLTAIFNGAGWLVLLQDGKPNITATTKLRSRTSPVLQTISSTSMSTINILTTAISSNTIFHYSITAEPTPSMRKNFPISGIIGIVFRLLILIACFMKLTQLLRYMINIRSNTMHKTDEDTLSDTIRQYRIVTRTILRKSRKYELTTSNETSRIEKSY